MSSDDNLLNEGDYYPLPTDESALNHRKQQFKNWIINLDVWGSFEPVTASCFDIETARAAAFAKV